MDEKILTKHDEVVVYRWPNEDRVSLTIQSKERGHDDYHMSQASTTMTNEQANKVAALLAPPAPSGDPRQGQVLAAVNATLAQIVSAVRAYLLAGGYDRSPQLDRMRNALAAASNALATGQDGGIK